MPFQNSSIRSALLGCSSNQRLQSHRCDVRFFVVASIVFLVFTLKHANANDDSIEFNRDIRPILSNACLKCHGPDANTREASLRLDIEAAAKESAVVEGDANASPLVERVFNDDPDLKMPPPDSGLTLTADEKQKLKKWIDEGAQYEGHWSFEPIERKQLPEKYDSKHPIDAFVLQRLDQANLKPLSLAPAETQLRRVSLDLTGLPPTIAEVDGFEQEIEKVGLELAYEKAVDRLLASPRYGERMAWSWLEAARYADTDGYQNDGPRDMWQWRSWVIKAYNSNTPFDQFTIEQLAGDLIPNATHEQRLATAFNRNNRYNSEAGIPIDEFLLENAVDRVDTTSTVWMGLTIGCARCHDHKYDPFSQKEYYQLIDYFNDVAESGRAVKFGNSEPWIKSPTETQRKELNALELELESAVAELESAVASGRIGKHQNTWVTNVASDNQSIGPVFNDGLTHFFDFEGQPQVSETAKPKGKRKKSQTSESAEAELKKGPAAHPFKFVGDAELVDTRFGQSVAVNDDGYVELPAIEGLSTQFRFSISFWMKPENVRSGSILSNEQPNFRRVGTQIGFVDGHLQWDISTRWIAGVSTIKTVKTFEPGEWVHVMATNDGTQRAKGMKLYVNGELQNVKTLRNTNSNKGGKNAGVMKIGHSHHNGTWTGQVDALRFYSGRTLTAKEAFQLSGEESFERLSKISPERRTERQTGFLQVAYLENASDEADAKLLADIRKARTEWTKIYDSISTTMIMEDLPGGRPSFVRTRGVYDQLGEKVQPGVPTAFPPLPDNTKNDRLGFAKWLVNGDHPLTARVVVNRYWQMLFGRGLVATAEDFGWQGDLPSHPELLDWLASEFVDNGWNVKQTLKTIVMSETYRRSSNVTNELLKQDPNNVLLARAPRLRLPGNVLRDQALFTSGLLVEKLGGPSVKPYQPKNLWKEASNFRYAEGKGDELYRRSLYTYWKRTLSPPTMALLDTADREWCSVKPKRTNTPLQALTLLNDTTFAEAAKKLADQVLSLDVKKDEERVEFAFRKLLVRKPLPEELKVLIQALNEYRSEFESRPDEARQVTQIGRSKLENQSVVEVASMTALMNVLMNLEEVTTRD